LFRGDRMPLIWRCAAKAARDSLHTRTPIKEVLKKIGWDIDPRAETVRHDISEKELTLWVQRNAKEIKGEKI
jgi:hypothetical protein